VSPSSGSNTHRNFCTCRLATCARLVSEQEVQAVCIDAATSNVELHYAYIRDAYAAFIARFQQQHAAHAGGPGRGGERHGRLAFGAGRIVLGGRTASLGARHATFPLHPTPALPADVLSRFEGDLQHLAATELHPALRGEGSPACLADLVDGERLREAAAGCLRGHQHFGTKVAELEGLFAMLKADVEALFMQVRGGASCIAQPWGLCRPRILACPAIGLEAGL
jgi:hypothetical protein